MPAKSGAASEVPSALFIVMSGSERIELPVMPAMDFWYDGRGYISERPAPSIGLTTKVSSPVLGSVHGGQGGVRWAVLPPTAVTHGESAQVAEAGPDETAPHCRVAVVRFCPAPQSPVAF